MHPDLLRALANERRAELLRHRHFRQPQAAEGPHHEARNPVRRVRRSIGFAFVGIGARLLRDNRAGVDLIDSRS
jgi:hypothetical protein